MLGAERGQQRGRHDQTQKTQADQTALGRELQIIVMRLAIIVDDIGAPVAREDAVKTPESGAGQPVIPPLPPDILIDLIALLGHDAGLLQALFYLFQPEPVADDQNIDHDQADQQDQHRARGMPGQDQADHAGNEQTREKGRVAHARMREHQRDHHHGKRQPQPRFGAQQQAQDIQQLPFEGRAVRPRAEGRNHKPDADGQGQLQITSQVVAIDKRAGRHPEVGVFLQKEIIFQAGQAHHRAIHGLKQAAAQQGIGQGLEPAPAADQREAQEKDQAIGQAQQQGHPRGLDIHTEAGRLIQRRPVPGRLGRQPGEPGQRQRHELQADIDQPQPKQPQHRARGADAGGQGDPVTEIKPAPGRHQQKYPDLHDRPGPDPVTAERQGQPDQQRAKTVKERVIRRAGLGGGGHGGSGRFWERETDCWENMPRLVIPGRAGRR